MTLRSVVRIACCAGVAGAFHPLAGQASTTASAWTEVRVPSKALGERVLRIATPEGYDTASRAYPLLILLDAQDGTQLTSAISTIRYLSARRAIQPLIVMGVVTSGSRSRDLTPAGNAESRAWISTGGGGDAFLDFVLGEAIPHVRKSYRTLPYTILAGHSLGGLIGAYAAATRPGAFNAIIAMSPALQYDGSGVAERYASAIAESSKPLRLVTTSGAGEPVIDWATSRFADVLKSRTHPNVVYEHLRYPHSHSITALPSLIDGLLFIFKPISLTNTALDRIPDPFAADSSRWVTSFVATESTYAQGARALPASAVGASHTLPDWFIRNTAEDASSDSPGAALVIARRGVALHPASAIAHDALAAALLSARDTAAARTTWTEALRLAQVSRDTATATKATTKLRELDRPPPRER